MLRERHRISNIRRHHHRRFHSQRQSQRRYLPPRLLRRHAERRARRNRRVRWWRVDLVQDLGESSDSQRWPVHVGYHVDGDDFHDPERSAEW